MKEVRFTHHAMRQMRLRGAEVDEVVDTIRNSRWKLARTGYMSCKARFAFNAVSPMNNLRYRFKTIEVILADDPLEIVVVTVKVYYSNLEAVK